MKTQKTKSNKIEPIRKFWANNKTKLFVATIVILAIGAAMQKEALKEHDNFLKENDLLDKYYDYIGATEDDIASFKD
jgi:predicted negative regulator of RcsB-dependent stress response